jgi:hypothetical protein
MENKVARLLPFISRTWVIGAEKDEETIKLCSIATLLKITSVFISCFYTENLWSGKACQVLCVKVTLLQRSTVNIHFIFVMSLLKWEHKDMKSTGPA